MEIRIYKNIESYSSGKAMYCARVECPEVFDFQKTLDVLYSIYGRNVKIVIFCF